MPSRWQAERLAYVAVTRARAQLRFFGSAACRSGRCCSTGCLRVTPQRCGICPSASGRCSRRTVSSVGSRPSPRRPCRSEPRRYGSIGWGVPVTPPGLLRPAPEAVLEQGRDRILVPSRPPPSAVRSGRTRAIGGVPRGAAAGDCARILEQLPFQRSTDWGPVIEQELQRSGLSVDWREVVEQGLAGVGNTVGWTSGGPSSKCLNTGSSPA